MRISDDHPSLTLLLVRHGETDWNAQNRWQGGRDIPLNDTGRQQAARLRDRLRVAWKDNLLPGPPDAIYASDLSRAVETARTISDALPHPQEIIQTPLLRERYFGSWEGLTPDEVRARFGDIPSPTDGESHESTQERITEALRLLWHDTITTPGRKHSLALVVGHGGSLRFFLALALGVGIEPARRFRLYNTGLTSVLFHGPTPETAEGHINFVNDTTHLW